MTKEILMQWVRRLMPAAQEQTLDFSCGLVMEQIENYCHVPEAPDGLIYTAALMVRNLMNSVQLDRETMQPEMKGVSRGDTSFSFASVCEQLANMAQSGDFLTDYKAQLNAYRRLR